VLNSRRSGTETRRRAGGDGNTAAPADYRWSEGASGSGAQRWPKTNLMKSERQKSHMVARISRNLNTPLSKLSGGDRPLEPLVQAPMSMTTNCCHFGCQIVYTLVTPLHSILLLHPPPATGVGAPNWGRGRSCGREGRGGRTTLLLAENPSSASETAASRRRQPATDGDGD